MSNKLYHEELEEVFEGQKEAAFICFVMCVALTIAVWVVS